MASGLEGIIAELEDKLKQIKAVHKERLADEAAAEEAAPAVAELPEESDAPAETESHVAGL